jgi:two-component system, NarL family, sensor histidine kinase DesK
VSFGGTTLGGRSDSPVSRGQRVTRFFWIFGWLLVLAPVGIGVATGEYRPVWLAATAFVAFIGLYVAAVLLIFFRERRARLRTLALVALAVLTLAATAGFGGNWLTMYFFLSAACGQALPPRWNVPAVVAVTAVAGAMALAHGEATGAVLAYVFGSFFGGMLNVFIARMRSLIRELRETREELARLAVEEERLRFSRDLHDLLGHTLSLIVVKSEAVRRVVHRDPDAAAREATDIEEVGRRALAEVREAVTGYRERSLSTELDDARGALSDAGIEAMVRASGTPLPASADALLGRALREGVTNVVRHSHAEICQIEVRTDGGQAVLEVLDDGVGGTGNGGNGLRGLAERVTDAGGKLEAGSRPGRGFRLAVAVPLESGAESAFGRVREAR